MIVRANDRKKLNSFEPDSNQRPKDDWLLPLQSSALPTELSKAPLFPKAADVPLILTKIALLQGLNGFPVPWSPAPLGCTEQRKPETEARAMEAAKGATFQP